MLHTIWAGSVVKIPAHDGSLSVGAVYKKLAPGLHRLIAELCPSGTARALVRTSILYWAGLDRQTSRGVLLCSRWPENLVESGCENSSLCKDVPSIGPMDSRNPTFRTEFRFPQGRLIGFEWQVPGVFLELADYAASPVLRRRVGVGASLAASPISRQVLQIRTTEAGRLLLNGNEIRRLRPNCTVSVNLSSLAEQLITGSGGLQLEAVQGRLTNLVRLVAPHQVLGFSQRIVHGECQIEMCFALPCLELRCRAENILTGETMEFGASCDDQRGWADSCLLRLDSRTADIGGYRYLLTLHTANLDAGAWFIDFEVCLAGRWGAPTNAREDRYAFGVLMQDGGLAVTSLETVLRCTMGPDHSNELLELFCRLHSKLQRCYAPDSWISLSWMKTLWERWLAAIEPLDTHKTCALVRLSGMKPPESSAISWLPTQRVEATVPHLFAQQARMYSTIYQPQSCLECCLSAIAKIERPLRHFPDRLADPFVAVGFGVHSMNSGLAPTAFDFEAYRHGLLGSPLSQSDFPGWLPADGELLGRLHYQACWERMRERYRETLSGNDARRQFGMHLCREAERTRRPKVLCLRRLERRFEEGESVEDGLLSSVESVISELAMKCRQNVRSPGELARYQMEMQSMIGRDGSSFPLVQVLSMVLQLGSDLFGFYLLLWELVLAGEENMKEEVIHA